MRKEGYSDEGVLGIIGPPTSSPDSFFILCDFEETGYVNDDDAQKIDADELLTEIKEGTKQQNERRKQLHLPPRTLGTGLKSHIMIRQRTMLSGQWRLKIEIPIQHQSLPLTTTQGF